MVDLVCEGLLKSSPDLFKASLAII